MVNQDIYWTSASDLSELIRTKKLSPVELTKQLIERIESINPKINAYVTVAADLAMAAAKEAEDAVMRGEELGTLHGVPVSVKDLTLTKGIRTTKGSRLLENFVPEEDAVCITGLKKAGAIILGKTNTPEFGCKAMTDNLVFGITRNPWDLDRTPSGSSGGAAAAVATGLGPLALGSDGGGSIRMPASCCGVFGIKPQFGRVPRYPHYGFTSVSQEGPLSRTVKDAALMLDAMVGTHWGDRCSIPANKVSFVKSLEGSVKGMKIAWSLDLGYAAVDHEVQRICEEAAKEFSKIGAIVETAKLRLENPGAILAKVLDTEMVAGLLAFGPLDEIKDKLHPWLAARIEPVQDLTAFDYIRAMLDRQELSARVSELLQTYDLLLTPTIGVPAWHIGLPTRTGYVAEVNGRRIGVTDWMLTHPFNLSGQPAASIPAGWTKTGLPVGLQIIGRQYDESTIFRAAAAFEQAKPWVSKRPSI